MKNNIIFMFSIGFLFSFGSFFSNSFQFEETPLLNNTNQNLLNEDIMKQYQKINESNFLNTILGIIAIITSTGAFIFAYKGDTEIKKLIHKLGFDIENFITDVGLKVEPAKEYYKLPITPSKSPIDYSKKTSNRSEKIVKMLEQIGQEKLSMLLQQAKIVSIELKDNEMNEWIQDELDGYQSMEKNASEKKLLRKDAPTNRIITAHFFIGSDDPSVTPVKIPKKVVMTKSIAAIEDIVKGHDERKIMTTLPYTITEDVSIKGEKVDLLIPREEWKQIIFDTEHKLRKYLEAHLN